ncbi:MAG: LytTR family DNA-binding domain-containing protein [Cyclobacteriaceae bacterium]
MYKVVIIDDEENGRQMVKAYAEKYYTPYLNVVALADSVARGVEEIAAHQPSLVFLDIEMPNESGFELFERLSKIEFEVIFVTAYAEYALRAFKVNAVDYVLKPIDPNDFKKAVNKALERLEKKINPADSIIRLVNELSKPTKIGLPLNQGFLYVGANEIVRCESSSNYTNVFLDDGKKYVICRTLKEVEGLLAQSDKFLRVHRSHLINKDKVTMFSRQNGGELTMADHSKIPISRIEKESLEKILNSI